jgi:hypothetical protein
MKRESSVHWPGLWIARTGALLGLLAAASGWAVVADAQEGPRTDEARAAYDQGVQAHARGAYAEAATLFAKADELAPNDTALQAAIEAATQARDPVLAMTLVERAMSRPQSAGLAASVKEARRAFGGRTGRVEVHCTGTIRCSPAVDGRPIEPDRSHWVETGTRTVVVRFGEMQVQKSVEVTPGANEKITVDPPTDARSRPPAATGAAASSAPEPAAPAMPSGVMQHQEAASAFSSPWFWVGAGLTLACGAATLWSASDVKSQHDDFLANGCDRSGTDSCRAAASDGKHAQMRTNLLAAATGLLGVATVTVVLIQPGASGHDRRAAGRLSGPWIAVHGAF